MATLSWKLHQVCTRHWLVRHCRPLGLQCVTRIRPEASVECTTVPHVGHACEYVQHCEPLFFFPGSAAGAAALKSGDAVRWWLLSIALATRGRAGAADPPLKSFSLLGFSCFWGFGVGEKRVKFADAFWRSLLGVFWSVFGQFFIIFWYCPRVKIV